jgi:energy-converting hydrogenase Eha subunit H
MRTNIQTNIRANFGRFFYDFLDVVFRKKKYFFIILYNSCFIFNYLVMVSTKNSFFDAQHYSPGVWGEIKQFKENRAAIFAANICGFSHLG